MPDEAVLDRVRKLLALATSPNVHEAAAAAARAQRLIERHRLEGYLAAERAVEEDPDPIEDARDEPLEVARRLRKWKRVLAGGLADVNGCVVYTLRADDGERLIVVGRSRDRAAVHALWSWLTKRIEWLSATEGGKRSKAWHEAFRIGAVESIIERLRDAGSDVRPAEPGALVQIDAAMAAHRDALERFVRERLRLGKGRSISVDPGAFAEGRAAGRAFDLP
ncbi:MAG: DUF2786 domain-containing protein [Myxococcota bacterium]